MGQHAASRTVLEMHLSTGRTVNLCHRGTTLCGKVQILNPNEQRGEMRTTKSIVTFLQPFVLSGYSDELPAGDYEVVVEEEQIEGLSLTAYRRIATYLTVRGSGYVARRPITGTDLETLVGQNWAQAT